jgi:hypothetical protein
MEKFEFIMVQGQNVVSCMHEVLKQIKERFLDMPLKIQSVSMITELVLSKTVDTKGQAQAVPVISMVVLLVEDRLAAHLPMLEEALQSVRGNIGIIKQLQCSHDIEGQPVETDEMGAFRTCKKCGAKIEL